ELIDMSKQKGTHARQGATDVCPFIPVSNVTQEECIEMSKKLAKRVGAELKIPTYLYGYSATRPEREKLPDIRKGEYEALEEKLKTEEFKPDYGEAIFNKKAGATVIGVRDFLLAYNINLNTTDKKLAKDIGLTIRSKGRLKRDKNRKIVRDENGNKLRVAGKLKNCEATGWFVEEYGYAQVTMNLHNYKISGLHDAFEIVREEARKLGLRVTGSELVGMLPKDAMLDVGKFYLKKQNRNVGISEREIIKTAILSLGLNDTTPFDMDEKIIEYKIANDENKLKSMKITDFLNLLSSDSPAPGGGSISALSGALSSALTSMVTQLTFNHKKYKRSNKKMEEVAIKSQELMRKFTDLIDRDTEAFNVYMEARKMPKKKEADKIKRAIALEEASKVVTNVPFETLKLSSELLELSEIVAKRGNVNAMSDAGVSAMQAEVCAEGAYLNVLINLPTIDDKEFVEKVKNEADEIVAEVKKDRRRIVNFVKRKLEEEIK
ncbi:MAG: glutamate formimidoyltransferase, partial [Candidatus Marinimicrobia bacterium]|nr:glutamate formimidoyltransferase [Candidatus Neomarinimicrobiota bacterium]